MTRQSEIRVVFQVSESVNPARRECLNLAEMASRILVKSDATEDKKLPGKKVKPQPMLLLI